MGFFLADSVAFLLLSAVGSCSTYHFTESVQFCDRTRHTVMKPEYINDIGGCEIPTMDCLDCHHCTAFGKAVISSFWWPVLSS